MRPLRVGFLLSGGGRTLENMAAYLRDHPQVGSIVQVISDRADAYGLERARRLGIPSRVLPCRAARVKDDSAAIFQEFEASTADLVLLGGFLRLLSIPAHWEGRVLNIHPSLIPKYAGHGFYGDRVHEAVIAGGERVSGCTVHVVDNQYDHGRILLQEEVPVLADDTAHTLAERVFAAECRIYPRAVRMLAEEGLAARVPPGPPPSGPR